MLATIPTMDHLMMARCSLSEINEFPRCTIVCLRELYTLHDLQKLLRSSEGIALTVFKGHGVGLPGDGKGWAASAHCPLRADKAEVEDCYDISFPALRRMVERRMEFLVAYLDINPGTFSQIAVE
ncbi:hypothetical protein D9615_007053 [Tricholomella constricta]|uniref:Uncharacterized protein n=1 Tax=Tricholomella constricta TaxID=117010 RepID=A0A8H5H849_9AGAR|nr:hypothetical protein D9615_007053 [Tricholomella constricta]